MDIIKKMKLWTGDFFHFCPWVKKIAEMDIL